MVGSTSVAGSSVDGASVSAESGSSVVEGSSGPAGAADDEL